MSIWIMLRPSVVNTTRTCGPERLGEERSRTVQERSKSRPIVPSPANLGPSLLVFSYQIKRTAIHGVQSLGWAWQENEALVS